ncbi:MAG: phospho-N-acetylmuramoyl-pentapeptide-transferase [Microthrixaceae bacterium]|nr:phospho-N-acetylmuramoyl-pentapeptide-transferase [Microthrixaceae bacterium]
MIALILASGVATLVSVLGTQLLINMLTRRAIGQPIHEDVPEGHLVKAGTPTMGGIALVAGGLAGYFTANVFIGTFSWTGLAIMGAVAATSVLGFLDDWTKVSKERNLGLNKTMKSVGLLAVAVGFVLVMLWKTNVHRTISFAQWNDLGWSLGKIGWSIFAVVLIIGTTNAVNLTDGLDGLAAGSAGVVFAGYVIMGYWIFRYSDLYGINVGLDLAVVAAAMMGACAGFLWWNAAPAQIFMGDTGSLAIGMALAGLALSSSTVLLLPIVGALFVLETASVIIQVASFRSTGKRVFKMAPIHHHFELSGWPETTVIIRLWMLTAACTAFGLGLFYREFVRLAGIR